MNPLSIFIVICLSITFAYFLGLTYFLSDFESEKCMPTYMFEYPQFVRIFNKYDEKYPKYELYAYSEGRLTERARNMYFDGVPVLFIPGNAGSHKQVRSLSSIALRKALNSHLSYHLDYFTINLNKEYSALNGALLKDQLDYINSSVYRILDLYRDRRNAPKSIILIGHSMGGVLARYLASVQPTTSKLFSIVLAIAAPLNRPPVILDYHMDSFYKSIKKWVPKYTTFVSISGSFSDFLIPSSISRISDHNALNVATTSFPLSWLQAHHVQILWCKQTVLVINRALFDCIDPKKGEVAEDPQFRMAVFRHHFIKHSGTKVYNAQQYSKPMQFDQSRNSEWNEPLSDQYSIKLMNGLKQPKHLMIKLSFQPRNEMLSVMAINLEVVDWAFVCPAIYPKGTGYVCFEGHHLSHLSEIAPSVDYKRRTLHLNLHELKRNYSDSTHVVLRVLPTSEPVIFHVDVHGKDERRLTVDLPRWWSLKRHLIVEETTSGALNYDLILPQLQHIIQLYKLYLEPLKCKEEKHHATASILVPWANENLHQHFTENLKEPLDLRLYNPRPINAKKPVTVRLTLDPSCQYKISIQSSIIGMLGQMARNYSPLLIVNIAVVVLMTFRAQLRNISEKESCSIFFVAVKEGVKPYYILTSVKVLGKILSAPQVMRFLPKPDWLLLVEDGSDFLLLPLFLYLCSVGIVWILAILFSISLITLESTVNKICLKFLAKTVSFTISWSDYFLSTLHKLPFLVAGLLTFLCFSTCGSLALCLGMVFYFLKLTQMSQDFIEEVVWFIVRKYGKKIREYLFGKKKSNIKKSDSKSIENKQNTDEIKSIENKIVQNDEEKPSCSKNIDEESTDDPNEELKSKDKEIVESEIEEINDSAEDKQSKSKNESEKSENKSDSAETQNNNEESEENPQNIDEDFTAHTAIFFHCSVFFLWFLVTLLNTPAVLTWAHNFKYSKTLKPDPSFIPGLALSVCAFILWQLDVPRTNKKWYDYLGHSLLVITTLALIYAPITLYRLNYLLTLVIILLSIHQLFAPPKQDENMENNEENDEKRHQNKYDDIKAKLD